MAALGERFGELLSPSLDRPTAVGAPGRHDFLDGLRGLAAFAIVVHHFTALSGRREIFASAYVSVDFFFCLSGFVIALAYRDRLLGGMSLRDYALKRLARLYPMFLLGLAFGSMAVAVLRVNGLTDVDAMEQARALALNVFYMPYFNADYIRVFEARISGAIFPLNNPYWSLLFGLVANLMFALSLRVGRALVPGILLASAFGLVIATYTFGVAPGWSTGNFAGGFPRVLYAFFAGVVLFQLYRARAWRPLVGPLTIVAIVAAVVLVPRFPGYREYWLFAALAIAPAIVALGCAVRLRPGGFAQKLCRHAGRISYPLFCLHYPLLMLMSLVPMRTVPFEVLLVAFLLVAIGISHFAAVYLEEPARALLERRRVAA